MATVRMRLDETVEIGRVDLDKVDALTEQDITRFNAEDGFDPEDTMLGLVHIVHSPASLRQKLGITQPELAARMRVPLETWRDWEQERAELDPAVRALLDLVADDPERAFRVLGTAA